MSWRWVTVEYRKLKEFIDIKTGKLDANASSENGKYPFFTCSKETLKINTYSYDCECVLLAGNGDLNVKYYNGKFDAYQRTYILECKNNIISTKYLYYFLKKYIEVLRSQSIGGVIKYIKLSNINDAVMPIYNSEYQEKIVKEIEQIENIIDIRNKQLKELENITKSQFVEMFGNPVLNERQWKIELFGNLGNFKNGMNFNKSDNGYKIRFLGVGDFNKGSIIHNIETLEIIDLKEKPSKEYMLEDKDIIFVRSNGSKELVGRSTLIDGIKDEITYSGFCIRYRKNTEEINTRYLIELFQNKEFFDYLKKDSRGANINNINQRMLSNLKIILPPIELQNQFAEIVKQIDKQKFEIENSLKEMQELYESLMEKYFG